jgi:uncharacterized membrane protein
MFEKHHKIILKINIMKKLIIVLIVTFSFSFMANANNTVINEIVTKIERKALSNEVKVEKITERETYKKVKAIVVTCPDGYNYIISCNSCSWGELLDEAYAFC